MKIEQHFTDRGAWGVALFILGNLLAAYGLMSVLPSAGGAPISEWVYIWIFGGSLANLISIPMMLVGRAYDVTIVHIPKDRIS